MNTETLTEVSLKDLEAMPFLFGSPVEELTDGSRLEPRGILNIQQIDVYLGIEGYARLIYMCV